MEYLIFFILFDVATGTVRALKDGEFKSEKARNGIYKKASELALLIFSYVLDGYLKSNNIPIQTYQMCLTYLIVMEITSILENFSKNKELSGIIDTIKSVISRSKGEDKE